MNIIVVDDEPIIVDGEIRAIRQCEPEAGIEGFTEPEAALAYACRQNVDVAFLDVAMPGVDGLVLAKALKAVRPNVNIIFATAYDEYGVDALRLHASGYILKPLRPENVRAELADLRRPPAPASEAPPAALSASAALLAAASADLPAVGPGNGARRMPFIRAFGSFAVFVDGEPLAFRYRLTQELLAYLVDRCGALVPTRELIAALWGDASGRTSYFKQLRKDLVDTLKAAGCEDILARPRGMLGILPDRVRCDYYDAMRGLHEGRSRYRGEYMTGYAWAEPTRAALKALRDMP